MENINARNAKNLAAQPLQQSDDLSKELEKYKALIKASNIGAWEYFSETEYLWCNEICFSMLGRDINDYDLSGKKKFKCNLDRSPTSGRCRNRHNTLW